MLKKTSRFSFLSACTIYVYEAFASVDNRIICCENISDIARCLSPNKNVVFLQIENFVFVVYFEFFFDRYWFVGLWADNSN